MLILYRILERYVNQLTYLLVYSFQIFILELTATAKYMIKTAKFKTLLMSSGLDFLERLDKIYLLPNIWQ